ELLRSLAGGRGMRPLRRVPAAAQGVRGSGPGRSGALPGRGPRRMTYAVKEIYYTLQGEGANTGRPAVFLRFAGCNLWTGREEERADAVCTFCDTDFVGTDGPGGGKFAEPGGLARAVAGAWTGNGDAARFVVCTGGEPLLQLDAPLVAALHAAGFEIAVETNGTQPPPPALALGRASGLVARRRRARPDTRSRDPSLRRGGLGNVRQRVSRRDTARRRRDRRHAQRIGQQGSARPARLARQAAARRADHPRPPGPLQRRHQSHRRPRR